MMSLKIILQILFAAVVSNALGMLWYSPKLFGKKYMELKGVTPEMMAAAKADGSYRKGMTKKYAISFLFSILTALGIFIFFVVSINFVVLILQVASSTVAIPQDAWYIQNLDVVMAFVSGFVTWLTFSVPQHANSVLWDKKPWKFFLINAGFTLVSFIAIAMCYVLVSRLFV